jgi:hypothetical protein
VRVVVQVAGREGRAFGGPLRGTAQRRAAPYAGEFGDRLLQLGADGAHGREVGRRALRDESDAAAPYGTAN